jgi:exoribonuclease-2
VIFDVGSDRDTIAETGQHGAGACEGAQMNEPTGGYDLREIARQTMIARGLQPDFPTDSLRQLESISGPAQDPAARDLRALLWCSIDNNSSEDLDQLTVSEALPGGQTKVLVAIADVDALVGSGTPIDRYAAANATTVYTPAQIFPMLPERLSTDLTSLAQGQDRLAVVVELVVTTDGAVSESSVYRATVRNQAKLAYHGVAMWLDGAGPPPGRVAAVPGLADQLRTQDRVGRALQAVRHAHGSLDFESHQPEVTAAGGRVVDLRLERQDRAQAMIAEFMIAANGAVAGYLTDRKFPVLERVVRAPERWDRIRTVAERLGEHLPASPDSKALAEFLARRRQADPLRFPDLSLTIVKLMGPGEYVVQIPGEPPIGHFGLAVRDYSHSTAPNRRFPDLITQRLVKAAVAGAPAPYTVAELTDLAAHCTRQEDAARKVERQVRKSAAAMYLADHIGETFDAIVTGVTDQGTWVRVLKPPVEGMLTAGRTGADVGDRLRVKLLSVDVERGFIDFARAAP